MFSLRHSLPQRLTSPAFMRTYQIGARNDEPGANLISDAL